MLSLASHDVQKGKQNDRTAPSRMGVIFRNWKNKVPAPTGGQRSRRDHQQTVEIQPPKEPDRAQPPAKRRTRHEGRLDDLPHVFQIPLVRFQCAAKYICTHGGRHNSVQRLACRFARKSYVCVVCVFASAGWWAGRLAR